MMNDELQFVQIASIPNKKYSCNKASERPKVYSQSVQLLYQIKNVRATKPRRGLTFVANPCNSYLASERPKERCQNNFPI